MYRRQQRNVRGFFRKAWMHTQHAGRQIDSFMRYNGNNIRAISQAIAPLITPENPALVVGIATLGQGAAS